MASDCAKSHKKLSISVVIITHNRLNELIACLNSVSCQTFDGFEIVLVDNGSIDGTPEIVEKKYSEVRVIRLPNNEGVPGARNIGAVNAKGDLLFFLDDDAIIEKGILKKISDRFNKDQSISVIACNLVDNENQPLINRKYDKEYHTADFPGGAVVIKKDLFQKLGYYPKDFFYAAEEADLSLRIYNAGFYIKYCPEILVCHNISASERFSWRRIYYCTRNNIWVAWKYLPFYSALNNSIFNLLTHLIKSFKHRLIRYYFKGVWDGILGIPKILEERKPINKHAQETVKRLHKGLNDGGQ